MSEHEMQCEKFDYTSGFIIALLAIVTFLWKVLRVFKCFLFTIISPKFVDIVES